MGRYRNLANNTLIFGICSFTSKLLVFIMLPLYTSVLTTEEFGIAELLTTTVGLLTPVLTLEIAQAAMRFALDKDRNLGHILTIGLSITILGAVILCISLPFVSRYSALGQYRFMFVALYFCTVINYLFGLFGRGIEKVRIVGIAAVASSFTVVIMNIIFLFVLRIGVKGYILSMIISNFIGAVILFVLGGYKKYIRTPIEKPLLLQMLKYSAPMVPNKLSWWINQSSSRYFLNAYTTLGDVGLFSAASKVPTIIDTFRGIFIDAWQLSMISEFDKKDAGSFFSSIYKAYNVFMILLTSAMLICSKLIATILFSKDFFEAWIYTPILLVAVFWGSMIAFYSPVYLAHKKTGRLFVFTLSGAIITIVFNFILDPWMGIKGAAISTALANFTIYILMAIDSRRYMVISGNRILYYISYALIIIQAIMISFMNISPMNVWSLIITAALVLINYRDISSIVKVFASLINKKFKFRK